MAQVTWEALVLHQLGAPDSPYNEAFLRGWERSEGGVSVEHINNPLNTTLDRASYPGYSLAPKIPVYPNLTVGASETAKTIEAGYPTILHALRANDVGSELGSPGFIGDLNKWVSGTYSTAPSSYSEGVAKNFASSGAGEATASDWTSANPIGTATSAVGNAVSSVTSGLTSGLESLVLRGLFMLVGLGIALVGLYLIARAMGVSPPIPMPGGVKSLGGSAPAPPPRAGDAAISRGEPVTRTGPPERRTRADKRQAGRNAAARERASRERREARDRAFGGDDDIPF